MFFYGKTSHVDPGVIGGKSQRESDALDGSWPCEVRPSHGDAATRCNVLFWCHAYLETGRVMLSQHGVMGSAAKKRLGTPLLRRGTDV